MKRFTSFCLVGFMMLLLAVPQAKAIITDPDDYIIWDSGILGVKEVREKFVKPDFMTWSVGVELRDSIGSLGRGVTDDHMEDFGFAPGSKAADFKNKTTMGALYVDQRKNDNAKNAEGERFNIDYATYMKLSGEEKLMPWTYSKEHNQFFRPSDSIVIRVPKTCDSIYIQGLGINSSMYSLMACEVGVSEVVPASHGLGGTMRTNVYHMGYNTGYVISLGFKPKHVAPGDSTTIIIFGSSKDYFADNTKGNLAHFCKDNNATKQKQIFTGETVTDEDGTVRDRYIECERWGQWYPTTINRIKIYGTIEKGEVPVYDGTHSAFTFSYQTKPSGTVELDKPLKKENGWSSQGYVRYASDLGVVRSVLSATSYIYLGYDEAFDTYATKLNIISATHDSVSYDTVAEHANYFQIKVPTTGFQDLTMDFDYALRGANNQVIVSAFINGDQACTVLDTLDNSANPSTQMAHASIAIPNEFANQKNLMIRIMMGKGAISGTVEFDLANLTFKGYNDYNEAADGAPKVAYITPAKDRVHVLGLSDGADAADKLLPYMKENENFKVSVIAKDAWSKLSAASADDVVAAFADYDVVVASPYMAAEDLDFAKALIGKKAFLNFNAQAFLNWNANAKASADPLDTAMVYAEEFYYHPIFTSIDLDEEKMTIPNIFDGAAAGVSVAATEGTYVLASGNNSGAAAIYEDYTNPKAKYLFVDLSADNSTSINSKGQQLLINATAYLKKGGNFVKPTFELNASGAVVENSAQLVMAANYDYGVLNLTTPVIKMKTSTDAGAVYTIPAEFGFGGNNITFQANSSDDQVVVCGMMADTEKLNATHLTFKNITFKQAAGQTAVLSLKKNDKVRDELKFDNCTFEALNGGFIALAGDSIHVKTITLNNCLFDGGDVATLINVEGAAINCNKVSVKENRFYDAKINTLLGWQTVATKEVDDTEDDGDELMSVNISNNTFRNKERSEAISLIDMPEAQQFDSVAVIVNNNLFYNAGSAMMHLYTAPDSIYYTTIEKATDGSDSTVITAVHFGALLNVDKNFVEEGEFVPGEYNWNIPAYEVVTKESLGVEKVFDDDALTQISKLSPMYTGGLESGLSRAYLGSAANYVSRKLGDETVFTVKNAPELKTALELAIGGDVIELQDNTEDPLGVYQIGTAGFTYPATGGKLIIRNAEGHKPVLFGNLAPSNSSVKLDELIIDGLNWNDPTLLDSVRITGYNADAYSPFYFQNKDGYIGLFRITNSTFENLEMQAVIRANKCYDEGAGTGLTIGKIVMNFNEFNNFGGALEVGKIGFHFIQFDVKGAYTFNNFEFVENVVKNFHGSQFFNITREGALNPADSTFNIKISNNVFYKIGGHATGSNATDQYRNFLEFNKAPVGYDVNIDITNNIFYKRWSDVNYPTGQLALFDGTQVKSYKINVLKNYFEGEYYSSDDTYGANPMAPVDAPATDNLKLSAASAVEVNRDEPLDWNCVNDWIEFDEDTEDFAGAIPTEYEVYTLGLAHPYDPAYNYIGAGLCYGVAPKPDAIEKVENSNVTVFANNGKLFINTVEAAKVDIYHISGQKIASKALNAGLNEVGALNSGMYILNVNGQMTKVLVK